MRAMATSARSDLKYLKKALRHVEQAWHDLDMAQDQHGSVAVRKSAAKAGKSVGAAAQKILATFRVAARVSRPRRRTSRR
jgi:hypothetical protein